MTSQISMNKPVAALCVALLALSLCVASAIPPLIAQQPDQKQKQPLTPDQRGERVFANNCARCHRPPMSIPPKATGAVIMHMRVRARLSSQEEQDLLHYLAP
jgi:mono/diheme cytochrome c family protein